MTQPFRFNAAQDYTVCLGCTSTVNFTIPDMTDCDERGRLSTENRSLDAHEFIKVLHEQALVLCPMTHTHWLPSQLEMLYFMHGQKK